MPMVNVSEKTLEKLKGVRKQEELKSLDGAILHLANRPVGPIELESEGPWPEHAITDINTARSELENRMRWPTGITANVHLSTILVKVLDKQLGKTDTSYRMFLVNNNLARIYEWEFAEDDVAVVRSQFHEVIIKNIRFNVPKSCDFCPNEFYLHGEAVTLKDGRLICHQCYTSVFELILSRAGRVKIQGERSDGMTTRASIPNINQDEEIEKAWLELCNSTSSPFWPQYEEFKKEFRGSASSTKVEK